MSAFDKGLLTLEQVPAFQSYLDSQSIGWAPGKEYEMMRAWVNDGWRLVIRNSKNVISTDPKLNGLISAFKNPSSTPLDTERLDYLINNRAKVEEYTASDIPFFYLTFTDGDVEAAQIGQYPSPRAAIDAAIDSDKARP